MHPPVDHDELEHGLDAVALWLLRADKVAVLTGAGISAESGLATFRGPDGLWEGHPVEQVATPEAFRRDPELVWRFYHGRRAALRKVRPNPGHEALAALEDWFGSERFTLVTQNVDGLHQAAGSRNVLEVHGTLRQVRCSTCPEVVACGTDSLPDLPRCSACGDLLRPAVVWFGEMLPQDVWWKAESACWDCTCFLVVGTSALVYPAAGLIDLARSGGARIIEVNPDRTPASARVDIRLRGPAGSVLPELLQRLKNGGGR